MSGQSARYSIKAVAERTGISTHTLRAWERRYSIPRPRRNAENRYRLYDDQDIADVLWLKQQVDSGLSPALAAGLLLAQRNQRTPIPKDGALLVELREALETAFAAADEPRARELLNRSIAMFTPEQVALQILEPVLRNLGDRWQRNGIEVWQEHLASNLIRQRIVSLILAQPDLRRPGRSLLAACAPEEQHELGLLLFTLLARRQGWEVNYLGQRTPLGDLLAMVKENRWVALSVATPIGLASLVPLAANTDLPRNRLLFGGYLPNQLPRLQEHLPGTFLGANAQEALLALSTGEPKSNKWMPGKQALRAGLTLQVERLKLCSLTTAQMRAAQSPRTRGQAAIDWSVLHSPAIFLIDALSSALAFDVPEIMDAQASWVAQTLPPRGIGASLIGRFLGGFRQVLEDNLQPETVRHVLPLLERLPLSADSALEESKK